MVNLAKALVGLAALAFVLAVVSNFIGEEAALLATAEGYSRASANLALLAIALALGFGSGRPAGMP